MKTTRSYTMKARAAAVEENRQRILDATLALSGERLLSDISLESVARGAGVSVQTVLRQFGSRAGLFEATGEHGARLVAEERKAPAGDVGQALRVLVDHYELRGDATVLLLAQEATDPLVHRVVESGRGMHRSWVSEVFAPYLAGLAEEERGEAVDLLVVATDVYAWKLLRRDRQLDRAATEDRMTRLTEAVLATATPTTDPTSTAAPRTHPTTGARAGRTQET